jgi:hypothetical protein
MNKLHSDNSDKVIWPGEKKGGVIATEKIGDKLRHLLL